jgi:hypothetical protein
MIMFQLAQFVFLPRYICILYTCFVFVISKPFIVLSVLSIFEIVVYTGMTKVGVLQECIEKMCFFYSILKKTCSNACS